MAPGGAAAVDCVFEAEGLDDGDDDADCEAADEAESVGDAGNALGDGARDAPASVDWGPPDGWLPRCP